MSEVTQRWDLIGNGIGDDLPLHLASLFAWVLHGLLHLSHLGKHL